MSALENLTAAIAALTVSVDRIVEAWNKPAPTEDQVQALANAVNAQAERLNTLLTPPAPEE